MDERAKEGSGLTATPTQGTIEGHLNFDGRERSYLLHIPPQYQPGKIMPLVIVLHGGGGDAGNAERMSQMSLKADKEGFIVVYPNGTGFLKNRLLTWNAWNCCGYALKNQVNDVGFIRALILHLQSQYSIDPKRVYATGLSNGGMMAHRLGCELSDKIAAIAPVAGALNSNVCQPSQPVSVIIFHGTEDQHVQYNGGPSKKSFINRESRIDQSAAHAVSLWTKADGTLAIPEEKHFGNIYVETYSGGKDGSEVVLYTIRGQGHAWPGGLSGMRNGNVDPPTKEISATNIMWDFFKKHPKK